MAKEAEIIVTDRIADSDIHAWMSLVVLNSILYHHLITSPQCRVEEMEYVKIPAPGDGIGVPVVKH